MTNEKIKFDKNCELWVQVVVDERMDPRTGKVFRTTEWQKSESDVSLGSMKEPKGNIIAVEWRDSTKKKRGLF